MEEHRQPSDSDGSIGGVWLQGRCESCGFESTRIRADRAGLIVGEPSDRARPNRSNEHVVTLLGDVAADTAEGYGYTILSAVLAGRYLRMEAAVCCECGHLHDRRLIGLRFGASFWWAWIILAVPYGIVFFLSTPDSISGMARALFFGVIGGGATIGVADLVARTYFRWHYPARVRQFATQWQCPKCGSKDLAFVGMGGVRHPCGRCGQRTVKYELEKSEA